MNILLNIISVAPSIFFNTNGSLKNINPQVITNTVDTCFNIVNVDTSSPLLAVVFNLSDIP